jgi:hypothetical protein
MKITIGAELPIAVFEMYWEDFERKFYKLPYLLSRCADLKLQTYSLWRNPPGIHCENW